jgi:hypothetical protein
VVEDLILSLGCLDCPDIGSIEVMQADVIDLVSTAAFLLDLWILDAFERVPLASCIDPLSLVTNLEVLRV